MRCPAGLSVLTPSDGCIVINLIERTLDLGVVDDLASLLKMELSFDSSSLTEVHEATTSDFHSERHLSNEVAVDSSATTCCSHWRLADSLREARVDDGVVRREALADLLVHLVAHLLD
jgi:hypothetical protein